MTREEKKDLWRARRFKRVIERDGPNCWICGRYCEENKRSIDHVIEKSLGGKSIFSNYKLAHSKCNRKRAKYLEKYFLGYTIEVPMKVTLFPCYEKVI